MCVLDDDDIYCCGADYSLGRYCAVFSYGVGYFVLWSDISLSGISGLYLYNGKVNTNTKSPVFVEEPDFILQKVISFFFLF